MVGIVADGTCTVMDPWRSSSSPARDLLALLVDGIVI